MTSTQRKVTPQDVRIVIAQAINKDEIPENCSRHYLGLAFPQKVETITSAINKNFGTNISTRKIRSMESLPQIVEHVITREEARVLYPKNLVSSSSSQAIKQKEETAQLTVKTEKIKPEGSFSTLSGRRQQAQESLGLSSLQEQKEMEKSLIREEQRIQKKTRKRENLEQSTSYSWVKGSATYMDKYFLDPILGFVIPVGGDFLTVIFDVPAVYVSVFKIRSLPLTLAVISNILIDVCIGLIPFLGAILDFAHRSKLKNFRLIKGFVEDDRTVIEKVNKRAFVMAIIIAIFGYLIYLLIKTVGELWDWLAGLIGM